MFSKMVMFKIVCLWHKIHKYKQNIPVRGDCQVFFFFIKHGRADHILSQYVAVSAASDTGLNSFLCIKSSIKH